MFQLNTYPESHCDRPNGPSSRHGNGCFFRWNILRRPSLPHQLPQADEPIGERLNALSILGSLIVAH